MNNFVAPTTGLYSISGTLGGGVTIELIEDYDKRDFNSKMLERLNKPRLLWLKSLGFEDEWDYKIESSGYIRLTKEMMLKVWERMK